MGRSRTNSSTAADLLIHVDRSAAEPLHRQIAASIRGSIRAGRLRLGTSLPPTRTIAADLGVSRGVVVEAYQQLIAEGYLTSRAGGYTQVAVEPVPPSADRRGGDRPAARIDFGYGRTDVSSFPRAAWLRSVRTVLTTTPNERFAYLDGRGVPELHTALIDYLSRVRGTSARPENVVICSGYGQGVALILQALAARGARRLAVEDPSADDDARRVAASVGLDVIGVPVGTNGILVEKLEQTDADAVVLTPSHQWPTGGVLSATARARVIGWAQRRGAVVIEDDYDAEYRYDRSPVGAMQGLAPDSVVYCGTASKTLAPGLRLGWLLAPSHLVDEITAAKVRADRGSPVIDQLTFADFLTRGEFDRHLRRMRPVYRRRRDALLAALRARLPELEPVGVAAGQHVVTWLPDDLDEALVVAAAARRGLVVQGVSRYRLSPAGPGGLIFGYANLTERSISDGVEALAGGVAEVRAEVCR